MLNKISMQKYVTIVRCLAASHSKVPCTFTYRHSVRYLAPSHADMVRDMNTDMDRDMLQGRCTCSFIRNQHIEEVGRQPSNKGLIMLKERKGKTPIFASLKTYNHNYLKILKENMRLKMENQKLKKKVKKLKRDRSHRMNTLLQAIETKKKPLKKINEGDMVNVEQ